MSATQLGRCFDELDLFVNRTVAQFFLSENFLSIRRDAEALGEIEIFEQVDDDELFRRYEAHAMEIVQVGEMFRDPGLSAQRVVEFMRAAEFVALWKMSRSVPARLTYSENCTAVGLLADYCGDNSCDLDEAAARVQRSMDQYTRFTHIEDIISYNRTFFVKRCFEIMGPVPHFNREAMNAFVDGAWEDASRVIIASSSGSMLRHDVVAVPTWPRALLYLMLQNKIAMSEDWFNPGRWLSNDPLDLNAVDFLHTRCIAVVGVKWGEDGRCTGVDSHIAPVYRVLCAVIRLGRATVRGERVVKQGFAIDSMSSDDRDGALGYTHPAAGVMMTNARHSASWKSGGRKRTGDPWRLIDSELREKETQLRALDRNVKSAQQLRDDLREEALTLSTIPGTVKALRFVETGVIRRIQNERVVRQSVSKDVAALKKGVVRLDVQKKKLEGNVANLTATVANLTVTVANLSATRKTARRRVRQLLAAARAAEVQKQSIDTLQAEIDAFFSLDVVKQAIGNEDFQASISGLGYDKTMGNTALALLALEFLASSTGQGMAYEMLVDENVNPSIANIVNKNGYKVFVNSFHGEDKYDSQKITNLVTFLEGDITRRKEDVAEYVKQNAKNVRKLKKNIKALKSGKGDVERALAKITSSESKKAVDYTNLLDVLKDVEAQRDENYTTLLQEVNDVKTQRDEHKAKLDIMQNVIDRLEWAKADVERNNGLLETRNKKLKKRYRKLKKLDQAAALKDVELANLKNVIDGLNWLKEGAEFNSETLAERNQKLKEKYLRLEENMVNMNEALDSVDASKNTGLEREIESLQDVADELEWLKNEASYKNELLVERNDILKEKYKKLEKDVKTANERIDKADALKNARLSGLEDLVEELKWLQTDAERYNENLETMHRDLKLKHLSLEGDMKNASVALDEANTALEDAERAHESGSSSSQESSMIEDISSYKKEIYEKSEEIRTLNVRIGYLDAKLKEHLEASKLELEGERVKNSADHNKLGNALRLALKRVDSLKKRGDSAEEMHAKKVRALERQLEDSESKLHETDLEIEVCNDRLEQSRLDDGVELRRLEIVNKSLLKKNAQLEGLLSEKDEQIEDSKGELPSGHKIADRRTIIKILQAQVDALREDVYSLEKEAKILGDNASLGTAENLQLQSRHKQGVESFTSFNRMALLDAQRSVYKKRNYGVIPEDMREMIHETTFKSGALSFEFHSVYDAMYALNMFHTTYDADLLTMIPSVLARDTSNNVWHDDENAKLVSINKKRGGHSTQLYKMLTKPGSYLDYFPALYDYIQSSVWAFDVILSVGAAKSSDVLRVPFEERMALMTGVMKKFLEKTVLVWRKEYLSHVLSYIVDNLEFTTQDDSFQDMLDKFKNWKFDELAGEFVTLLVGAPPIMTKNPFRRQKYENMWEWRGTPFSLISMTHTPVLGFDILTSLLDADSLVDLLKDRWDVGVVPSLTEIQKDVEYMTSTKSNIRISNAVVEYYMSGKDAAVGIEASTLLTRTYLEFASISSTRWDNTVGQLTLQDMDGDGGEREALFVAERYFKHSWGLSVDSFIVSLADEFESLYEYPLDISTLVFLYHTLKIVLADGFWNVARVFLRDALAWKRGMPAVPPGRLEKLSAVIKNAKMGVGRLIGLVFEEGTIGDVNDSGGSSKSGDNVRIPTILKISSNIGGEVKDFIGDFPDGDRWAVAMKPVGEAYGIRSVEDTDDEEMSAFHVVMASLSEVFTDADQEGNYGLNIIGVSKKHTTPVPRRPSTPRLATTPKLSPEQKFAASSNALGRRSARKSQRPGEVPASYPRRSSRTAKTVSRLISEGSKTDSKGRYHRPFTGGKDEDSLQRMEERLYHMITTSGMEIAAMRYSLAKVRFDRNSKEIIQKLTADIDAASQESEAATVEAARLVNALRSIGAPDEEDFDTSYVDIDHVYHSPQVVEPGDMVDLDDQELQDLRRVILEDVVNARKNVNAIISQARRIEAAVAQAKRADNEAARAMERADALKANDEEYARKKAEIDEKYKRLPGDAVVPRDRPAPTPDMIRTVCPVRRPRKRRPRNVAVVACGDDALDSEKLLELEALKILYENNRLDILARSRGGGRVYNLRGVEPFNFKGQLSYEPSTRRTRERNKALEAIRVLNNAVNNAADAAKVDDIINNMSGATETSLNIDVGDDSYDAPTPVADWDDDFSPSDDDFPRTPVQHRDIRQEKHTLHVTPIGTDPKRHVSMDVSPGSAWGIFVEEWVDLTYGRGDNTLLLSRDMRDDPSSTLFGSRDHSTLLDKAVVPISFMKTPMTPADVQAIFLEYKGEDPPSVAPFLRDSAMGRRSEPPFSGASVKVIARELWKVEDANRPYAEVLKTETDADRHIIKCPVAVVERLCEPPLITVLVSENFDLDGLFFHAVAVSAIQTFREKAVELYDSLYTLWTWAQEFTEERHPAVAKLERCRVRVIHKFLDHAVRLWDDAALNDIADIFWEDVAGARKDLHRFASYGVINVRSPLVKDFFSFSLESCALSSPFEKCAALSSAVPPNVTPPGWWRSFQEHLEAAKIGTTSIRSFSYNASGPIDNNVKMHLVREVSGVDESFHEFAERVENLKLDEWWHDASTALIGIILKRLLPELRAISVYALLMRSECAQDESEEYRLWHLQVSGAIKAVEVISRDIGILESGGHVFDVSKGVEDNISVILGKDGVLACKSPDVVETGVQAYFRKTEDAHVAGTMARSYMELREFAGLVYHDQGDLTAAEAVSILNRIYVPDGGESSGSTHTSGRPAYTMGPADSLDQGLALSVAGGHASFEFRDVMWIVTPVIGPVSGPKTSVKRQLASWKALMTDVGFDETILFSMNGAGVVQLGYSSVRPDVYPKIVELMTLNRRKYDETVRLVAQAGAFPSVSSAPFKRMDVLRCDRLKLVASLEQKAFL